MNPGKRRTLKQTEANTEILDTAPARAGGTSPFSPPPSEPSTPPARQLAPVAFRVWRVASAHPWHQLAGFEARAKALAMGPLTIPEWEQAYQDFLTAPMK